MSKRFAVIGDPVNHSLSPIMHTGWFADHGIDATYEPLALRTDDAITAIKALRGFSGANITVPHKEAAAKAARHSKNSVANVLRWEEDGSISAFNTDGAGFMDSLDEAAPGWRTQVRKVLVVGAGGAGQGVGRALAPHVENVCFTNRTLARAGAAAVSVPNGSALAWDQLASGFADADLIVQTTTLGMAGQPAMDWPLDACRPNAIIADIVYRPLETDLLRATRARGLKAVDGLGMLIHQGAHSFEIWFGVRPDAAKARARLLAALT
jgi:shikimate dehydrogenase